MLSGHPESFALPAPPALDEAWMWAGAATNTAFVGPWGISFAANLTPDENTGLGIWTEEMFVTALRTGKHMGQSRPIMPPMPWPGIAQLTDEDLHAIYSYLRSIPPVVNHVPDYQPPAGPEPAGELTRSTLPRGRLALGRPRAVVRPTPAGFAPRRLAPSPARLTVPAGRLD